MEKIVFTPDDEPYLGLEELIAFDRLIVASMDEMARARPHTFSESLTDHQKAATLLVPSGMSLCLSVRELIRQAHLHGALTLQRPILERAVTVSYLRKNPSSLRIWEQGWEYNKRPKLREMISDLYSNSLDDETQEQMEGYGWTIHQLLTSEGNDIIHGGPGGLLKNVNFTAEGAITSAGRNVDRPDLAKRAALDCSTWLSVLLSESLAAFPDA